MTSELTVRMNTKLLWKKFLVLKEFYLREIAAWFRETKPVKQCT